MVFNPNQKEDLLLQISAGVLKIYVGNTFRGEQGFDIKSTQRVSRGRRDPVPGVGGDVFPFMPPHILNLNTAKSQGFPK